MSLRRSSIHSTGDTDDEQLLELTTASDQQHERFRMRTVDGSLIRLDMNEDKQSETDTESHLSEAPMEPTIIAHHACRDAPARYVIATWAFFGFFCLYATRVNLSLAIVAMVRYFLSMKRNEVDRIREK
jgi:hypothetical protein